MICKNCKKETPADALFCPYCGKELNKTPSKRKRGNGTGSIFKAGDKYKAEAVLYYYVKDGKLKKKTVSKTFTNKKDAVNYLSSIKKEPEPALKEITLKGLYDKWLPTHNASRSTINCYKAGFAFFEPLWYCSMQELSVDELQECIDDCPKGKRTRQNMKTVLGLIYKFGIPRNYVPKNLNLATFLKAGEGKAAPRKSFTPEQIKAIKDRIGKSEYADYVYCLIYLGFRPSELLNLKRDNYIPEGKYFVGGAKTEAGIDRIVPVSPKIEKYINLLAEDSCEYFFHNNGKRFSLKKFTQAFYKVLEDAGIDNPIIDERHMYTPHTCRHTFSTLLKKIKAPVKDKLALIGHSSEEMLLYYQDSYLEDLRKAISEI